MRLFPALGACFLLLIVRAGAVDSSPIQSLSSSEDGSLQAIAAAAGRGAAKAAADIKAGRLRILEYGEPRLITAQTRDPQTGYPILALAGCTATAQVRAEADAYNAVMRQWCLKEPAVAPK